MSDPQEYKALIDTGAQCIVMPSSYKGADTLIFLELQGDPRQEGD